MHHVLTRGQGRMTVRSPRIVRLGLVCAVLAAALIVLPGPTSPGQAPRAVGAQGLAASAADGMFNIDLQLPQGCEVTYLRLYYYDVDRSHDSAAWLTAYTSSGSALDLAYVESDGPSGYSSQLSSQISHIVDHLSNAYVLNWKSGAPGPGHQLCGLRVMYREDGGTGASGYIHVAGTVLRPRYGSIPWRYGGDGCLYQARYAIYLPLITRRY
jgi:hypothetical protein